MKLKDLFLPDGSCPTMGDPYRDRNPTVTALFDGYGDLREEARDFLYRFVAKNPVLPFSDAVLLLVAWQFSCGTKDNYTTHTLWRAGVEPLKKLNKAIGKRRGEL